MEIVLQWLDEIDDLVAIAAAQRERLRQAFIACLVSVACVATLAAAAVLAIAKPLLAPVLAGLLLLSLLYHRQLQSGRTQDLVASA